MQSSRQFLNNIVSSCPTKLCRTQGKVCLSLLELAPCTFQRARAMTQLWKFDHRDVTEGTDLSQMPPPTPPNPPPPPGRCWLSPSRPARSCLVVFSSQTRGRVTKAPRVSKDTESWRGFWASVVQGYFARGLEEERCRCLSCCEVKDFTATPAQNLVSLNP